MSKRETPMTHRYWERVRGTLLEEYLIVPSGPGVGRRMIDAVIIEDGDHRIASRGESVSLDGHDIRRDQPVEWPQRATIVPTLPFNLHGYPQR